MLLSAAISRSGLVEHLLDPALSKLKSPSLQIPALAGAVMLLSMVTKNIGALAIVMPVALQYARKSGLPASRILIPMAFASFLGGLVTVECNTFVMGPGGYQVSDYWKLGLPLSKIVTSRPTH